MTFVTKLTLLRHGESTWNLQNIFTGWTDVPLSDRGRDEAREAGRLMADEAYVFDEAHTSVLTRAIDTLHIALMEMDLAWIPVRKHWRLNERHYGALQGLNKKETADRYGTDQVHAWRRSYRVRPPEVTADDPRHPVNDPRYADVRAGLLPHTECLADVVERLLPYWYEEVVPQLQAGRRVVIAAHGNSIRALVKHLDQVPDEEITDLNIPTGIPLVYELDADMRPLDHYYLGDATAAAAAAEAVARQAGG